MRRKTEKTTEKQEGQKIIEQQGRQTRKKKDGKGMKNKDELNHLEHLEGGGQTSHWETLLTLT